MRWPAPVLCLVLNACSSSHGGGDACVAEDAGPPPPGPPLFVPAPGCAPLLAEERCERFSDCPDAELGPYFAPFDVKVLQDERIAYVEVLAGAGIRAEEGWRVGCGELLRYRVGLDDLSVALVGHYCAPPRLYYGLEEEVLRGPGWPGFYLCDWSEALDLEVRVVVGLLRPVDSDLGGSTCVMGSGCRSSQAVLWIRRHSTGEPLASYGLEPSWSWRCTEHAVQLPREGFPDGDGTCDYAEGCTVMCGGYTPCAVPLEGRHIGPDGFCYEAPLE